MRFSLYITLCLLSASSSEATLFSRTANRIQHAAAKRSARLARDIRSKFRNVLIEQVIFPFSVNFVYFVVSLSVFYLVRIIARVSCVVVFVFFLGDLLRFRGLVFHSFPPFLSFRGFEASSFTGSISISGHTLTNAYYSLVLLTNTQRLRTCVSFLSLLQAYFLSLSFISLRYLYFYTTFFLFFCRLSIGLYFPSFFLSFFSPTRKTDPFSNSRQHRVKGEKGLRLEPPISSNFGHM